MPPRALEPSGIVLWDKPAGPSSFAIVSELRRRTGARTGHAGTLDPFATGLLVLLSGRATRLASRFVGLDKRYLTDIDLSLRARRPAIRRASPLERLDPPDADELERGSRASAARSSCAIPAASAVKIGGERAYKLHRRGIAVEMPLRRSPVDALDLLALRRGIARLDLRVSSGTYVRAIAHDLGGHCRDAPPDRSRPVRGRRGRSGADRRPGRRAGAARGEAAVEA